MKKTALWIAFVLVTVFQFQAQSQTPSQVPKSLGLPGDNFNLYAALKVFQESKTLEAFERSINDPEKKINNLDLNGDDQIDYIRVEDKVKDNVHSITLKVGLDKNEEQDIAVFVVTRESDKKVFVQVVGDEDLYGKNYIIEPNYEEKERPNPGFQSEFADEYVPATRNNITYVEVASWPIVQYIYVPTYNPWVSYWGWNRYPQWWSPWRPYSWHWYAGFHYNYFNIYFGYYHRTNVYRNPHWYSWHYGNNGWRSRSVIYVNRSQQGYYRTTYSRPQTFDMGYRVSRDRVPANMRPVMNRPGRAPFPSARPMPSTRPMPAARPMPGNVRPSNNGGRGSREMQQEPPGRGSRELNNNGNGRGRGNGNGRGNDNRPSRHYN